MSAASARCDHALCAASASLVSRHSSARSGSVTASRAGLLLALGACDTVELRGNFRAADGYFAADQTSFWGCKVG